MLSRSVKMFSEVIDPLLHPGEVTFQNALAPLRVNGPSVGLRPGGILVSCSALSSGFR